MRKITALATAVALAGAAFLAVAPAASATQKHEGPTFPITICHGTEVGDHHDGGPKGTEYNRPPKTDPVYTFETIVITDERGYGRYFERGQLKDSPPDYMGACTVPTVPGAAPAPSPLPYMQAYGIAPDGVCDPNFTPDWAAMTGLPEGGWGKSFQQWAVPITGGYVCVRMFVYNNSTHSWVFGK